LSQIGNDSVDLVKLGHLANNCDKQKKGNKVGNKK